MSDVTREDGEGERRYVLRLDGHEAKLVLTDLGPGRVSADHTAVPPALQGRGVASRLVEALVADARAEGWRIVPRCSYVAAQARRHPDWADLFDQT